MTCAGLEASVTSGQPLDPARGRGEGTAYFGKGLFMIGDDQYGSNPNDVALGAAGTVAQLWLRNADTGAGNDLALQFVFEDSGDAEYYIYFYTTAGTDNKSGSVFEVYLGTDANDGEWRFLELDLQGYVDALDGTLAIDEVNAAAVWGEDVFVDDMVLAAGKMRRSYAVNPLAALGPLGAQSGEDGGASASVAAGWSRWWYSVSDLYTVLATTDDAGERLGGYAPDFYGNYRTVAGERPDAMGLTTKFEDPLAGAACFGARWYDSERGRWITEDPVRTMGGLNFYGFVHNRPYNRMDPTGLREVPWPLNGKCCNYSPSPQFACIGGRYWMLCPGSCTRTFTQDCDGMTCGAATFFSAPAGEQIKCSKRNACLKEHFVYDPPAPVVAPGNRGCPPSPAPFMYSLARSLCHTLVGRPPGPIPVNGSPNP